MKKLLAILLLLPLPALADFVVGDVTEVAADTCAHTLNGATLVQTPVVVDAARGNPTYANRVCRIDVSDLNPGPYNIKVKVQSVAKPEVWADSPFASLDFVRRGVLAAPGAIRLAP